MVKFCDKIAERWSIFRNPVPTIAHDVISNVSTMI